MASSPPTRSRRPPDIARSMATKAERSGRTRAAVVAAAVESFGRRGYTAVTMSDIARTAGVTRGALYHHFDDKHAVFLVAVQEVDRSVAEEMTARAAKATTHAEHVGLALRAYVDRMSSRGLSRLVAESYAYAGVDCWPATALAVREALRDDAAADDPTPQIVAVFVMGAARHAAALRANSTPERAGELDRVLDRFVEWCLPVVIASSSGWARKLTSVATVVNRGDRG
jgi:AcrR family transcriptional regulator